MTQLLFIDTNIYLDFYRMRNEGRMRFLDHLKNAESQIIMTQQVQMEFKNNRQRVIIDTINSLKPPVSVSRPGLLSDDRSYAALQKDIKNAAKRIAGLKVRMKRVLADPARHDPVYKFVKHICRNRNEYTLDKNSEEFQSINELAQKRFTLGYPPQKKGDTSVGDAINWEWIISVCKRVKPLELLIVSRDSDYGATFEKESYLNDWLNQEFRERVGRTVSVKLYAKLADALKDCNISVSQVEESSEERFVAENSEQFNKHVSGKCLICGSSALFDVVCNKCGNYVICNEDGENYSLDRNGKLWSFTHHDFDEKITCECGSDSYEIEWQSLCSYCDHQSSKDD